MKRRSQNYKSKELFIYGTNDIPNSTSPIIYQMLYDILRTLEEIRDNTEYDDSLFS